MSLKTESEFTKKEIDRPEERLPYVPKLGTPVIIEDLGETTILENVIDPRSKESVAAQLQAETFLTAVKDGKGVREAAKEVGVPLRRLMGSPAIQKDLEQLLADYTWEATVRKEVSRATANKILIDGNYKERIDVMKVINADPEVGIGSGPQVAVQTNIVLSDETAKVAEKVLDIKIDGLD